MGGRAPQGMPLECTAARHQRPNAHFTPWNWQVKINSPTCSSENLPPAAAPGSRGPPQSAACLLRSLNATLGPSSNRMKKNGPARRSRTFPTSVTSAPACVADERRAGLIRPIRRHLNAPLTQPGRDAFMRCCLRVWGRLHLTDFSAVSSLLMGHMISN